MNLHQIVSSAIGAVNPNQPAQVFLSNGFTQNPDGTRTPAYFPVVLVLAQVQELTIQDIRQLDALNIQGSHRSIYFMGEVDAIIRVSQKGGDKVITVDGRTWLTTAVLEKFDNYGQDSGWCKVAVTLQNGS